MQLEFLMNNPVDEANAQQRLASTPTISVFVSASAGSGKTKLLVDRLLRLMLPRKARDGTLQPGTHPQKIQCLTYSKAAAAEMAIRLQRKLSEWVGSSEQELNQALLDLEVEPNEAMRKAARALFAQVLDLPGGMRIETNHAFCQSILQRFPLEASISPQFKIIEEGDNILAFKRAFDEKIHLASEQDIELLSPIVSSQNFLEILQELQQNQRFLPPVFQLIEEGSFSLYLRQLLQLSYSSRQEYLHAVCEKWRDETEFKSYLQQALEANSKKLREVGEVGLQWLAEPINKRMEMWGVFSKVFISRDAETKQLIVAKTIKGNKTDNSDIAPYLIEQGQYVLEVISQLNIYTVYEYTLALMNVFAPIWKRYQEIKRTQGALYYNDLIAYTLTLLDDPGSAWVLYKLDGGLDHILLDEVQDNSAEQWKIAADLSTEFFSGMGRDEDQPHPRTVFAVGDYKQSIYSFQGAKPQEFLSWQKIFKRTVSEAGQLWEDPQLRVSFRSSQIILDFVDHVFDPQQALKGLSGSGSENQFPAHRSARTDSPGRVDIWPLTRIDALDKETEMELWQPLKENQKHQSAELILAETLADWISKQIGKVPPYGGKPIQAGDILILIRKRSVFSKALIRSLKSKNIPLANLVKTQLLDQLAVQDLLVLCEVLLLSQDDLTLACVLKSPLGGLSEDSLMELAAPRKNGQSLWGALFIRHKERPDWTAVWKMLSSLFLRIDYVTPYALLVEILGEHQGRTRLLARLGGEAIEAIDELLAQALQYETLHTPSLQGFLYWLKQSERMIKNETESSVDMVRIMTVHGAKGLQGRLVILPDTMNAASKQGGFQSDKVLIWKDDPSSGLTVPLYIPQKQFDIAESQLDKDEKKQSDEAESNRLLYVALTRASEWLLICGWQKSTKEEKGLEELPVGNWYRHSVTALRQLNAHSRDFFGGWEGEHLWIEQKALSPEKGNTSDQQITKSMQLKIILPAWMGQENNWVAQPLASEKLPAAHLAPSRPEGIEMGDVPSVISPLQTKAKRDPLYRGRLVHQLLQYLPDFRQEERADIALHWLTPLEGQFSAKEIHYLVKQVLRIIEHPELHCLFDKESLVEQPLVGTVNGVVVTGQIDRMRILSDQILLCDFKSGRKIPQQPDETPVNYLKQMAAYWSLLKLLYPKHRIKPLIVWTDAARIMFLPQELLMNYIPTVKDNLS